MALVDGVLAQSSWASMRLSTTTKEWTDLRSKPNSVVEIKGFVQEFVGVGKLLGKAGINQKGPVDQDEERKHK